METEKEYYEYFNYLYKLVHSLNKKQYEELNNFLGDMEQCIDGDTTLKEIEKYIKKYKAKNKILFITFKTKSKNKLAHICKYIINLEGHNEWAIAVAGQSTPTIFGWCD